MNGQPHFAPRVGARMRSRSRWAASSRLRAPTASAVTFETEDVKGSFDSTISFGMQWRMSGTSCRIIGNDNGGCAPTTGTLGEVVNGPGFGFTSDPDFNYLQSDNGNLNYKKHQLVSSVLKGNHELALRFRDGWSALGRFSWLYDPAADNTERTPLSGDAKSISVHNITLLDLWLAKDFELAGPAGQGEGRQPGAELGRGHLHLRRHQHHQPDRPHARAQGGGPAQGNLPAGADGFVQLSARPTTCPSRASGKPAGTRSGSTRWARIFPGADVVGKGQQQAFVPSSVLGAPPGTVGDIGTISNGTFIPAGQRFTSTICWRSARSCPRWRRKSPRPRTSSASRRATRRTTRTPSGDSTTCITTTRSRSSASSTIPAITDNPFGLGYFLQYGRNRNLFGASVNGNIGDWAVGAELSYRPKDGVGIDPTVPLDRVRTARSARRARMRATSTPRNGRRT